MKRRELFWIIESFLLVLGGYLLNFEFLSGLFMVGVILTISALIIGFNYVRREEVRSDVEIDLLNRATRQTFTNAIDLDKIKRWLEKRE